MKFRPAVQEEMLFKDISYLKLWQPFCSAKQKYLCNFSREYYEEQFCEIIFNLDQWFRRKCLLTIFFIWSTDGTFVQQGRPNLCNFSRGYQEENFCEIILNLNQWFRRRCCLKIFLIWCSGSPFVQRSRTICAIFEKGIMRNYSAK